MKRICRKEILRKRRNKLIKELLKNLVCMFIFGFMCFKLFESIFIYPELHQTTARYQLKCKIDQGNEQAIEYYKTNYTNRGVYLYGEDK